MDCDQAQQLTLWITVENPVENPNFERAKFPPHAPPSKKRLLFLSDVVRAIEYRVEVSEARLEALEFQMLQIAALADEHISHEELIKRIRALREDLGRHETEPRSEAEHDNGDSGDDECRVCGARITPGYGRCYACARSGREVPWRR